MSIASLERASCFTQGGVLTQTWHSKFSSSYPPLKKGRFLLFLPLFTSLQHDDPSTIPKRLRKFPLTSFLELRVSRVERELFDPEKFFSAIAVVAKEGLWNSPVLDENSLEDSLRHLEDDIDHTSMFETGTRPTIITQQASTTTMS